MSNISLKTPICLVRGSINIDEFFHVQAIVRPGQTLSSTKYERRAGGKGANQACAISKAGGKVYLAGSVGNDGKWVREQLQRYGVMGDYIEISDEMPTGRAVIQLDQRAENSIILYKGANYDFSPISPGDILKETSPSYVLLQNEIPWQGTIAFVVEAKRHNASVVFNPSPMPSTIQLKSFPWAKVNWLIVNQCEAEDILDRLGVDGTVSTPQTDSDLPTDAPLSARSALASLTALRNHRSFSPSVHLVCTLGADGVLTVFPDNEHEHQTHYTIFVPGAKARTEVVDTTGAGDCFTGYFVAELMSSGADSMKYSEAQVKRALDRSVQAACISVERRGAMGSQPTAAEVDERIAVASDIGTASKE